MSSNIITVLLTLAVANELGVIDTGSISFSSLFKAIKATQDMLSPIDLDELEKKLKEINK